MQKHSWHFEAIGTKWSIDTLDVLHDEVKARITSLIEDFDRTYSRFRDDSLVSEIAVKTGEYDFPENAGLLIEFYKRLYTATDGAVSPLVGNILSDAGYDKDYSLQPGSTTKAPVWDDAFVWHETHVTTKLPVLIDFGAAGKGYLVDIISRYLDGYGLNQYTIDGSGDMHVRGHSEIIGLENPYDATMVIGTAAVENESLCASAVNRRAWGDWHHVIDPRTGQPTREIVATWVVAPTTLEADGLATALFFVGPDNLSAWKFTYVRLFADGHIEHSPNFVGELYI
ncbi:MAG: FAD:protein transferase [Candidatus Saccharibacteria bacterium]|nr:FAD:protein transferase [Candidatus Saccharibacteria bacterium]